MHKVIIKNKDETLEWGIPYLSWSFSEELNNDRNAQLSFSYEHLKRVADASATTVLNIVYGSLRIVEIYNDDTLLYKGYLQQPQRSRNVSDKGVVSIGSKGLFQLLDKRLTNDVVVRPDKTFFPNDDLSDIAWDLINYTQTRTYGDLGITRGLNPVTRNAQRTYNYDYVGEAIDNLCNKNRADGIDFELDLQNNFNIYYPFKGIDNGVVFTDGSNIRRFTVTRPSVDELVNEAVTQSTESYGEGSLTANSSGTIDNKNNYGLLEEFNSDDATQLSTVQEKADNVIVKKENPYITIDIEVDGYSNSVWSSVNIGDFVKVIIQEEEVDGLFRVYSMTLDNNNIEKYKLEEDINI